MDIIKRLNELLAENPNATKKVLDAYLTIDGYSDEDKKAAFKEVGIGRAKPRTFASEFYDWLSAEKREPKEVTDYVMGLGEYGETSNNVKRHRSHYENIGALTAKIWDNK